MKSWLRGGNNGEMRAMGHFSAAAAKTYRASVGTAMTLVRDNGKRAGQIGKIPGTIPSRRQMREWSLMLQCCGSWAAVCA